MTDHDAIAAKVRLMSEVCECDTDYCRHAEAHDDAPDYDGISAAYLDLYDEVKRLRADLTDGSFYKETDIDRLQERAEKAEAERDRLRAALTIYAQSGNWRLGGCCDPNSPNFTGEAIAREALKGPEE